jgi:hypothetical protein
MEYDLEIIVSTCLKYQSRFRDFKKYGLLNIKDKKIKVNVILSNLEAIWDIENDWPVGVDVKIITESNYCYIQNLYNFFLKFDLEKLNSRWIMKVDDDSVTDVSGLINNLDQFYDHNESYYLAANCSKFENVGGYGPEYWCLPEYVDCLEKYKQFVFLLQHETECCVISKKGFQKILKNKEALNLLSCRSKAFGGCTDCTLAFASSIAKVYPIDCPFLTHLPELQKFSLLPGGFKNHIHLISREVEGENFGSAHRGSSNIFLILTKVVDNNYSSTEKKLEQNKCKINIDGETKTYKFLPCHILAPIVDKKNSNFFADNEKEEDVFLWLEKDKKIYILDPRKSALFHKDQVVKTMILNQKIF